MTTTGLDHRAAARIAAESYDAVATAYESIGRRWGWSGRSDHIEVLRRELPPGSRVVDLGCGTGVPLLPAIGGRHSVIAVDVSLASLAIARRHPSRPAVVAADLVDLALRPGSVDAVVCWYALTHVPSAEHATAIAAMARWLRPGGLALLSVGAERHADTVAEDFLGLGVPMPVGHHDAPTYERLVELAGLRVRTVDVREQVEDGRRARFCWIVAERSP